MGLPEDLQPLDSLFQRRLSEISSSAGQAITRELKRLSKIPPQSAEYGVGKTYIEWLLSLPWKKVTETPHDLDLAKARSILDDEHEGLEKVKRRVVEYLAVYQLKRKLFEEEAAAKLQEKKTTKTTHQAVQNAAFDASTAGDLLELIPKDERKALEETQTPMDDILTKDVYRDKGPILLLVGPPGVGKTSIARSLATSLGRKLHRISLGGVRDEAEIRGHRRTYIGALPGLLVQGLRKVGVANPVILLDELDKVGTSNFHGDPSAALLEALDPAQNWSFHDHYLGDVPIDLSQCMFIATANTLDTISPPLLDRCETITCSGYVTSEKLAIAKRFLLPKQVKENGLLAVGVQMGDGVIEKVITEFTFEAGVRSLEREISRICRTKAVEYSTARQSTHSPYNPEVTSNDVDTILGVAHFDPDVREETHRPGVVTGLAWQASGTGGIMLIETTLVPGGNGQLVLTGSLGGVISESAQLGLTWVKSHSASLGILLGDTDPYKSHDIHLHLPAGSVKKDGPSAGIGMVLAIASLLTGRVVPSTTAVTGEITLRGAVTPVGGIKEKVLGAHRAGIRKIILPKKNLREVMADLPESVKDEMDFVFVGTIEEALEEVWGKDIWTDTSRPRLEAKL
ncbi:hypothetical protein TREMEDRAFT_67699 [Tremella mesenterica DSM 1558]|uniref:uncharacterized protein n=1 Tax=Tremella mesenterica (strain ATCC 24925 / CBS 8224 / DSM 1558 / NBRC 9311 / NRRL Y-6157 / RJB 2259-6 / UBC 559-6) TaxID=578456 RepID=UPI0003F49493|nr:uncharacterized protein TREMEDRAFT_67699 [Tremella mesenterica DSM 1558]EIW71323.1 hypothetical protein TREMEDRAFT_67699 [Tremella mesenterica DSM 1558]